MNSLLSSEYYLELLETPYGAILLEKAKTFLNGKNPLKLPHRTWRECITYEPKYGIIFWFDDLEKSTHMVRINIEY
jgi:hypothetical protein